MKNRRNDFIRISPRMFLYSAIMVMILPLNWLISAIVAALVHELFHYGAVRLCGGRVLELRMDVGGMVMEMEPLTSKKEIICALAGPVGSLMLLLLVRQIPMIALCAGVQGIFNLLPIYPLDGGRAVRNGVHMLLPPDWAEKLYQTIEKLTFLGMLLLGMWGTVKLSLGLIPILLPVLLWLRTQKQR